MITVNYTRKPLRVEAVQVTEDNFYEVAKWTGGDIATTNGKKYIQIAVLYPLHQKQSKANIGDWVLQSAQGFKIYTDAAFMKGFTLTANLGEVPLHLIDEQFSNNNAKKEA